MFVVGTGLALSEYHHISMSEYHISIFDDGVCFMVFWVFEQYSVLGGVG
jgi:hypothetical protein